MTKGSIRGALGVFLVCLAVSLYLAVQYDMIESGLSSADEPGHFVNSYFVWDYLSHAFPGNPVSYAREFYVSYPKLTIGHWPPLYYLVTGPLFFIFPKAPATLIVFNVIVATAPVFLIALLIMEIGGWKWALFAGLAYITMPLTIAGDMFFMLDPPVVFLCLLAAMAWIRFMRKPGYGTAILFGGVVAAAILTKGNGWLLGLFAVLSLLLARQWALFMNPTTYAGAVVTLLPVIPWYWETREATADTFAMTPGFAHTWTALRFNTATLLDSVGLIGLGFAVLAVVAARFLSRPGSREHELVVLCVSLIGATVIFQSVMPVLHVPRHMTPAVPPAVILMVLGMVMSVRLPRLGPPVVLRRVLVALAASVFLVRAAFGLWGEPLKLDMQMDEAAESVLSGNPGQVIVVDGHHGGEGAFIAETMIRTRPGRVFVVRTSKLLGQSAWSGQQYKSLVRTSDEVLASLRDLGASAVVVERCSIGRYYEHSLMLTEALDAPGSPYHRKETLHHRNGEGVTHVYVARTPPEPDTGRVREVNFPGKSGSL